MRSGILKDFHGMGIIKKQNFFQFLLKYYELKCIMYKVRFEQYYFIHGKVDPI